MVLVLVVVLILLFVSVVCKLFSFFGRVVIVILVCSVCVILVSWVIFVVLFSVMVWNVDGLFVCISRLNVFLLIELVVFSIEMLCMFLVFDYW